MSERPKYRSFREIPPEVAINFYTRHPKHFSAMKRWVDQRRKEAEDKQKAKDDGK